ncbi:MAG: preprotein translocase subunit SecE [Dehalococcoidia bacterium]|nr:preprotein translocase subunit SecE [Dehalococcoidia bacterium]
MSFINPDSAGSKLGRYVSGVVGELKKVTWPSRSEILRLSGIVLVICIVMGLIMGGVDYGFAQLVNKVFIGGM